MKLALSDSPSERAEASEWPGRFVALGGLAATAHHRGKSVRDQTVVALSVPHRAYVAALLASGWAITRRLNPVQSPHQIAAGARVRVVTDDYVIVDQLAADWKQSEPTSLRRQSTWMPSHVRAVIPVDESASIGRSSRPEMGALARWASMSDRWENLLESSADDLVLVGTQRWLHDDMTACLVPCGTHGCPEPNVNDTIGALLLPKGSCSQTWGCHVIPTARIDDQLPLRDDAVCVVLDGASAVRNVARFDSPWVFCVIDRSIADQSAAELLVQLRNTRGVPISVGDELGWRPVPGVEVTGFRLAM